MRRWWSWRGNHKLFHGLEPPPDTSFVAASLSLVMWFWSKLSITFGAGSGAHDHARANYRTPCPDQYDWSRTGLKIWVGSIRSLPGALMPSEFLSILTRCFRDIKSWGRQLQSPSVGVEAWGKKVVKLRQSKREEKEWGCQTVSWWPLISWVQPLRSLDLLWFLCPRSRIPSILPISLPFPWSQLELGSSH